MQTCCNTIAVWSGPMARFACFQELPTFPNMLETPSWDQVDTTCRLLDVVTSALYVRNALRISSIAHGAAFRKRSARMVHHGATVTNQLMLSVVLL